jgi:hypothetical protein
MIVMASPSSLLSLQVVVVVIIEPDHGVPEVLAPDRPEAFGLCDDGRRAALIAALPLAERLLK